MSIEARKSRALAAASSAASAVPVLIEFARDGGDPRDLIVTETAELILDAAKMALELVADEPDEDGERNQVLAAIARFLEGWA